MFDHFASTQDIVATLALLKSLPTDQGFPAGSKFYVFQEVIDQNDGAIKVDEYYDMGIHTVKFHTKNLFI